MKIFIVSFLFSFAFGLNLQAQSRENDRYFSIEKIDNALQRLQAINGYQWMYKVDANNAAKGKVPYPGLGFILEELIKTEPVIVEKRDNGQYAYTPDYFLPYLVEGVKALDSIRLLNESNISSLTIELENTNSKISEMNEDFNSQIEELKSTIEELKAKYLESQSEISNLTQSLKSNNQAKLFQNTPNPFNKQCEIQYFVPINSAKARLLIMDMTGTLVKEVSITNFGSNNAVIPAGELKSGMYFYSLVVDNKEADTKKMIILK